MNESDMPEHVTQHLRTTLVSLKGADIAKAMAAAQAEMRAAKFDSINPHFKSRFASLASVAEAVRVFPKHGVAYMQAIEQGEHGIRCITTLVHESGQAMSSASPWFKPSKPDAHGVAAAVTYARRIGLATATGCVADEDDDGNGAVDPLGQKAHRPVEAAMVDSTNGLSAEDVSYLSGLASELVDLAEAQGDSAGACNLLEAENLDNEQKLYLWNLLGSHSKTRSALKKESDKRRSTKNQEAA